NKAVQGAPADFLASRSCTRLSFSSHSFFLRASSSATAVTISAATIEEDSGALFAMRGFIIRPGLTSAAATVGVREAAEEEEEEEPAVEERDEAAARSASSFFLRSCKRVREKGKGRTTNLLGFLCCSCSRSRLLLLFLLCGKSSGSRSFLLFLL